jgi:hypothetical protein
MGISLTGLTPSTTYDALIKVGDNGPIDGTLKTLSDGLGNNLPMEVSTTGVNLTGSPTVNAVAIANTTQVAAKQDTLVSGTNIKTINGVTVLGSGDIVTPFTPPSGVSGAIQFSTGSAFGSDAANLFWDDTNKRLGVRTNTPTNPLTINTANAYEGIQLRNGSNLLANINKWANDGGYLELLNAGAYYCFLQANGSYLTTNMMFGTSTSLGARVGIRGSGSTSATTSLLVQNSAGTAAVTIKDDLSATFGGNVTTPTLTINGNWVANNFQTIFGTVFNYILNPVNIGGTTQTSSAMLEVRSTTRGFLPPVMTTTQKNAIASPAAGLVLYDSTTNKLQCYNGSTWNDLF